MFDVIGIGIASYNAEGNRNLDSTKPPSFPRRRLSQKVSTFPRPRAGEG